MSGISVSEPSPANYFAIHRRYRMPSAAKTATKRPLGEIGIRSRLKICRPKGRAGSSPAGGTIFCITANSPMLMPATAWSIRPTALVRVGAFYVSPPRRTNFIFSYCTSREFKHC